MRNFYNSAIETSVQNSANIAVPNRMKFEKLPWQLLRSTVGRERAETGGMLLGDVESGVISHFVFDTGNNQRRSGAAYDPDVNFLNSELDKGRARGLELLGFVHSHPRGVSRLSGGFGNQGDVAYLKTIFRAMPELKYLYTPIVFSTADGQPFEFFAYVAKRGEEDSYRQIQLHVTLDSDVPDVISSVKKPNHSQSNSQYAMESHRSMERQCREVSLPIFEPMILNQVFSYLRDMSEDAGGLYFGSDKSGKVYHFVGDRGKGVHGQSYIPEGRYWRNLLDSAKSDVIGIAISMNGKPGERYLEAHPAVKLLAILQPSRRHMFVTLLDRNATEEPMSLFVLQRNEEGFNITKKLQVACPESAA